MNCPTCTQNINKKWKYCPECGSPIKSEIIKSKDGEYQLEKIKYLFEREKGGKDIYDNFKSIRYSGIMQWKSVETIRPNLKDFTHISLPHMRKYSFVHHVPTLRSDFYKIGKLIGYSSSYGWMKTLKFEKILGGIKWGLHWQILENKKLQEEWGRGWKNAGGGLLYLTGTNRKKKTLLFSMMESPSSVLKSKHKLCLMETGCLCGQAEVLTGKFVDGYEINCQCKGGDSCEFKAELHDSEEEPRIEILEKRETNEILKQVIDDLTGPREKLRNKLGNLLYISIDQLMNYLLISTSPGHAILSKHSGILCGERIAEKACLEGDTAAFDYACDLFLYLKAGILHKPETKGDNLVLKMDESVYSSGVNNIQMKLDIFLAGIIEGLLNQSTGERWNVEETKCLANGDDHCQFTCRRQNK